MHMLQHLKGPQGTSRSSTSNSARVPAQKKVQSSYSCCTPVTSHAPVHPRAWLFREARMLQEGTAGAGGNLLGALEGWRKGGGPMAGQPTAAAARPGLEQLAPAWRVPAGGKAVGRLAAGCPAMRSCSNAMVRRCGCAARGWGGRWWQGPEEGCERQALQHRLVVGPRASWASQ